MDGRRWLIALALLATPVPAGPAEESRALVRLDAFESADGWKAMPADGVEMRLSSDAGARGRALRIDFRFVKGGGYAVLHRDLAFDLPANYRFTWKLRGECPNNNLEFKLVDSTGANVWWCNRRDLEFEVVLELLTNVLSDVESHQLGHIRRGVKEQNTLDNYFGVFHLIDGLLLDEFRQLLVLPVLAHLGVKEVLVNGCQFFLQREL